ncbi:MAG: hypothetical protein K2W82_17605 [Candidatus Obscuribacterales bacterium]|nr:hypothetical protein [Candidatus Obscuribacterales bacterium]
MKLVILLALMVAVVAWLLVKMKQDQDARRRKEAHESKVLAFVVNFWAKAFNPPYIDEALSLAEWRARFAGALRVLLIQAYVKKGAFPDMSFDPNLPANSRLRDVLWTALYGAGLAHPNRRSFISSHSLFDVRGCMTVTMDNVELVDKATDSYRFWGGHALEDREVQPLELARA